MHTYPNALAKTIDEINLFDCQTDQSLGQRQVILEQNVCCFLMEGNQNITFSGYDVRVSSENALIVMQGNCLFAERTDTGHLCRSVFLFFSKQILNDFLRKHQFTAKTAAHKNTTTPFFVIEKDNFVRVFIQSLSALLQNNLHQKQSLLLLKFEEIMLYFIDKYGENFIYFLKNNVEDTYETSFKTTIETHKYTKLTVDELAFLCNMSRSTFKRHFVENYQETPAKWLKDQRLNRAKELLQSGYALPSELYKEFGYEYLSNFSTAFRIKFGVSPSEIKNEPFA